MADEDQAQEATEAPIEPAPQEAEANVVWTDHLTLFLAGLSDTRFSRHTPTINRINALAADMRRAIENCPGR